MENSSNNTSDIRIYKFSNCLLNPFERKVLKNKQHIEIASKAFDILQLLIEKQGEVVTKDEILEKVWDDSFVEEGNLTVYVSQIRKALGANKTDSLIETVTGVGYRFVARVKMVDESEWDAFLSGGNQQSQIIPNSNSIAVLPFRNENNDNELDYLADGITESLMNNLSYIPNLRVIARNTVFRYKNKEIDIRKVGEEIGVTAILTGRIRMLHNRLVINVELTDAQTGSHIWGTNLNEPFEDIFEMQEHITQTISENLKTQIGSKKENLPNQTITQNPESYRLYLKGKYFLNRRSIENLNKAVECFQQSISKDPTNSHTYIELAYCYYSYFLYNQISHKEAVNIISTLLDKAYSLKQELSEFYLVNGIVLVGLKFNMSEAEINFEKALLLNPNSVEAHFQQSILFCFTGRTSEGLKGIPNMMELDPISLKTTQNIARIFHISEQHENSIERLNECLELSPNNYESLVILGANLVELNLFDEALEALNKAFKINPHPEALAMIGYVSAKSGKTAVANKILKSLKNKSENSFISPCYLAFICSALGKIEETFKYLEIAVNTGDADLITLKIDPRYKPIRHDPRFNEMLKKIGLPID